MTAAVARRLRQLVALAQVLAVPGAPRALRTWKPFSITSFRITHALHARGLRFRTVVDGGANAGQFARAAAETWPGARVVSFEPLPDVAARYRAHLGGRARLVEAALGPDAGTLPFHRTPYSLASSALAPTDGPSEEVAVPVVRLDDALANEPLERPLLLKLDLQGFELEALRGGRATLARADAVLLETAFVPGYAGEPLFRDVLAFMEDAGFRFAAPLDVLDLDGQITQMDALFLPFEDVAGGHPAASGA